MPARTTRQTSERLAKHLRKLISSGQWDVGDRLPSIRELARKHGVSKSTVQTVLAGMEAQNLVEYHPRRGGVVRSRVPRLDAATERRTRHLAVIHPMDRDPAAIPQSQDFWLHHIIAGMQHGLVGHHCDLVMLPRLVDDPAANDSVLERLDALGETLAGVVVSLVPGQSDLISQLDQRGVLWVTIDRPDSSQLHNFVAADNVASGRLVGKCFGRLGLERALVFGSNTQVSHSTADKLAGFVQGYLESGGKMSGMDYLPSTDSSETVGYDTIRTYLGQHPVPGGVFTMGDRLALGAIRACREHGLRVPEDIGIVSSTGLMLAAYGDPPLTVVTQPMHEMGVEAADMLLSMARAGTRRITGRIVPGRFVFRESVTIPEALRRELHDDDEALARRHRRPEARQPKSTPLNPGA